MQNNKKERKNNQEQSFGILEWKRRTRKRKKKKKKRKYLFSYETSRTVTFFYYLVCEAIGTAATPGLLCQLRVIMKMIVEKQMECRLAGGTAKFSEKTCPSATFVHHKIPHDQTRV
jgi:hypothetical protein